VEFNPRIENFKETVSPKRKYEFAPIFTSTPTQCSQRTVTPRKNGATPTKRNEFIQIDDISTGSHTSKQCKTPRRNNFIANDISTVSHTSKNDNLTLKNSSATNRANICAASINQQ